MRQGSVVRGVEQCVYTGGLSGRKFTGLVRVFKFVNRRTGFTVRENPRFKLIRLTATLET